jgi:CDP-diacylglycerol---serine O-phosphatidyltransferase
MIVSMEKPFPPFDPDGTGEKRQQRLRDIPLRTIFPNLVTLLAICSGLTSIRFASEGKIGLAVAAIILAGVLDGLDGRIARMLKSTTRFGAQLDSLADFLNFGVAPAMLIYFTLTDEILSIGWITALIYAICACLRLARFNVMLDMPDSPKWHSNFFVGVPAPAGALCVLTPVYVLLLGVPANAPYAFIAAVYTVMIGLLMVSSLPTFSGKEIGRRIPRDYVLPLLILLIVLIALLLSYPWPTLLTFAVLYLASLPFSYNAYQQHIRQEKAAVQGTENNHASQADDTDISSS